MTFAPFFLPFSAVIDTDGIFLVSLFCFGGDGHLHFLFFFFFKCYFICVVKDRRTPFSFFHVLFPWCIYDIFLFVSLNFVIFFSFLVLVR